MTVRLTIAAAAVAIAVAGGAAALFARSSSSSTALQEASTPRRAVKQVTRVAEIKPEPSAARVEAADLPVTLTATQRIATVHGRTLTGRDLIAWRADAPTEQEMTAQMFASLKQRAIDRELTFAEARRHGIELTAAQRAQLAEVRVHARERGETDVAQLDLEETDARAHLLATRLLEKAEVAPPFATEADVKAYAEAHGGELDERQIREALATELQESYQRRVRAYFDALRTGAVTE